MVAKEAGNGDRRAVVAAVVVMVAVAVVVEVTIAGQHRQW